MNFNKTQIFSFVAIVILFSGILMKGIGVSHLRIWEMLPVMGKQYIFQEGEDIQMNGTDMTQTN